LMNEYNELEDIYFGRVKIDNQAKLTKLKGHAHTHTHTHTQTSLSIYLILLVISALIILH